MQKSNIFIIDLSLYRDRTILTVSNLNEFAKLLGLDPNKAKKGKGPLIELIWKFMNKKYDLSPSTNTKRKRKAEEEAEEEEDEEELASGQSDTSFRSSAPVVYTIEDVAILSNDKRFQELVTEGREKRPTFSRMQYDWFVKMIQNEKLDDIFTRFEEILHPFEV